MLLHSIIITNMLWFTEISSSKKVKLGLLTSSHKCSSRRSKSQIVIRMNIVINWPERWISSTVRANLTMVQSLTDQVLHTKVKGAKVGLRFRLRKVVVMIMKWGQLVVALQKDSISWKVVSQGTRRTKPERSIRMTTNLKLNIWNRCSRILRQVSPTTPQRSLELSKLKELYSTTILRLHIP